MNPVTIILLAIVALFVLLLLYAIGINNTLVRMRNQVKNAFAQIDVQLKRRYDLIPNLVEAAKGYITHERETLESVIKARNMAFSANQNVAQNPGDANAMKGLLSAETVLSGSIGKFMALAESYPDLKANQNISQLMEELTSTENRISYARQHYNDSAMEYNTAREIFPNSLVANTLNFAASPMWEITDSKERENVKVSFK